VRNSEKLCRKKHVLLTIAPIRPPGLTISVARSMKFARMFPFDLGRLSSRYDLVDLGNVMMTERKLPENFVNTERNGITPEFAEWLNPMLLKTDYFPIVNFN